jgi:hypothetical protein
MRKAGRRPVPEGDERACANLELADPGAAGGRLMSLRLEFVTTMLTPMIAIDSS